MLEVTLRWTIIPSLHATETEITASQMVLYVHMETFTTIRPSVLRNSPKSGTTWIMLLCSKITHYYPGDEFLYSYHLSVFKCFYTVKKN